MAKKERDPIGVQAALAEVSKLTAAYEQYFWEDASFNPADMTDADIDAIIAAEQDLGKMIDPLILAYKIYQERKSTAEKKAKFCTVLIGRIMTTMGIKEYEGTDWRTAYVPAYKWETDMEKLPEEFKMECRSAINAKLLAWEKVEGVKNPEWRWYARVY